MGFKFVFHDRPVQCRETGTAAGGNAIITITVLLQVAFCQVRQEGGLRQPCDELWLYVISGALRVVDRDLPGHRIATQAESESCAELGLAKS
ncbi:MAG: hypothetical protein KatS3mg110_1526 [Pirellulaceae bacterium]|nr:MAG: hypothetical protein KatS3mg110_1526 [Pirellulaceae bacterium]